MWQLQAKGWSTRKFLRNTMVWLEVVSYIRAASPYIATGKLWV
jgi:hypothetical protein